MKSPALSDEAKRELAPLFAKMEQLGALLISARKISYPTIRHVMDAYAQAAQGDAVATEIAEREIIATESTAGFASLAQDSQLETLARLRVEENTARYLLRDMNTLAKCMVDSKTPGVREAIDYLVQLDSHTTITDSALETQKGLVSALFQDAIRDAGVHAQPIVTEKGLEL